MRRYLNPQSFICPNCHKMISMKKKIRHGYQCAGKKVKKEQRKETKKIRENYR